MAKKSKETISYKQLTKSQKEGADYFDEWFRNKKFQQKPILRIGGPAGTGKSFFIRYLKEKYKLTKMNCLFVSYTGQAVNILRRNGIPAKTIHSTFMEAREVPLKKDGKIIKRGGIPLMTIRFIPVTHISSMVKLIIVDEASFLPETLEELISSFNVPVLEMGDPIQLPPVAGKQCFNLDTLDVFFNDPMRHAKESEILELATRIRLGMQVDPSRYFREVTFMRNRGSMEETFQEFQPFFQYSDCTICATNRQRTIITDLYRRNILKTESPYPVKGERLICRRNNWNLLLGDYPLTNGTIGKALYTVGRSSIDRKTHLYYMDFKPEYIDNDYYSNLVCDTDFLTAPFGDKGYDKYNIGNKFEYAHAITVHLSQGSQFNSVLYVDQYIRDLEYLLRLRYTAVTRAQKNLYYILP